jgi:hypothetical protein
MIDNIIFYLLLIKEMDITAIYITIVFIIV